MNWSPTPRLGTCIAIPFVTPCVAEHSAPVRQFAHFGATAHFGAAAQRAAVAAHFAAVAAHLAAVAAHFAAAAVAAHFAADAAHLAAVAAHLAAVAAHFAALSAAVALIERFFTSAISSLPQVFVIKILQAIVIGPTAGYTPVNITPYATRA
ncbi:hypothetical protein U1701_07030 [Sphingomonas sp. PB2P19]|uniref:hypothetical protein n=1 Tax=Sphingomonas rhamnosi TaxID=3096156 RepID=UPI002FC7F7D9